MTTQLKQAAQKALEAMEEIRDLKPHAFDGIPADWNEQIAACPDCQRYKRHPIQNGICDTHRQPLWARERHNDNEESALGYRAMHIARNAAAALRSALLHQEAGEPQPVAYAVFVPSGNIRMWSTNGEAIHKFAAEQGVAVTPLYTSPPPQPTDAGLTDEADWQTAAQAAMKLARETIAMLNDTEQKLRRGVNASIELHGVRTSIEGMFLLRAYVEAAQKESQPTDAGAQACGAVDIPGWKSSTLPFTDEVLQAAMANATAARAYAVGADPKTATSPARLPWCREFARAVLNAASIPQKPAAGVSPIDAEGALGYAARLADALWRKHYQQDAPNWGLFPDLLGILTQIDNMAAGLMKKPAAIAASQACCAAGRDGDAKA